MIKPIVVLMMSVVLSASIARANIYDAGDVIPANAGSWTHFNDAYIGKTGIGVVIVDNYSDLTTGDCYLGLDPDSMGVIAITGVGTTWSSGDLHVGYSGDGTMSVTDNAVVSSRSGTLGYRFGSTGAVSVNDGATWKSWSLGVFIIGFYGGGALDITNGGIVEDYNGAIGSQSGSVGVATVSGAGSTWTNSGQLSVAYWGAGRLDITDGGTVRSSTGGIGWGEDSTGVVTVSGAGSTWHSGNLGVGGFGESTLAITNGGSVSSGSSKIGSASGTAGTVTVSGAGSAWTNRGDLRVGRNGTGTLEITDGAAVDIDREGFIADESGSVGVVTVTGAGSTFSSSDDLWIGHRGDGRLEITSGAAADNARCFIGYYSDSSGAVTVSGAGSTWNNSGDLRLGHYGDGVVHIAFGGLASVGGGLSIDLRGRRGSFITMAAGGMLALAGEADDSLAAFLGLIEGADDIRYWDDSILDWAHISGATPGDDYTLSYLTEGDLAGYTVLTVATVPEPATLGMLALGGLGLIRRRRRR